MKMNRSHHLTLFGILYMVLPVFAIAQTGVNVSIRVLLQGALMNENFTYSALMRDDLRAKNYLPSVEPYSSYPKYQHLNGGGLEMVTDSTVFQTTGENAIVDWVFVELRYAMYLDSTLATRSALLTRKGDVVDVDGISPVNFGSIEPGEYYVVVRHRNHLGVMSATPINLNENSTHLDFSDPTFPTNGNHAQRLLGDRMALWCGDLNQDGRIIYQGPGNDILKLFTTILYHPDNTYLHPAFMANGYHVADANMDGKAIFVGKGSDKIVVFMAIKEILIAWHTSPFPEMFVLLEQVP